jgi:cbb3-type cytochrome oxidase subunit 3
VGTVGKNYFNEFDEITDKVISNFKKRAKRLKIVKYLHIAVSFYELYFAIKKFSEGDFVWAGVFLGFTVLFGWWAYRDEKKRQIQIQAAEYLEQKKFDMEKFIEEETLPGLN